MTEVEAFLESTLPRLREADTALHNGDAGPRSEMWSHEDPVTLFGAALNATGWADVGRCFDALAARFANCTSWDLEVVAAGASRDLAYLVGIEHTTTSIGGAPAEPYELRVTLIFRREDGEWKLVHRHGDPRNESGSVAVSRFMASASAG